MDPLTMMALASMAAGTIGQIGTGQQNAEAQRRAREGQIADQLAASDARRGYRGQERARQTAYSNEAMGEANTAVGRFNPTAWGAGEDAAYGAMAPAWEANSDAMTVGIGGQRGSPQLIAQSLANQLDLARVEGRRNAGARAKLAAGDVRSLSTKGDSARTSSRIAAINDFSGASQALLPLEQAIVPEIVTGTAPRATNPGADAMVGLGQVGLAANGGGFGDTLAKLLGRRPGGGL